MSTRDRNLLPVLASDRLDRTILQSTEGRWSAADLLIAARSLVDRLQKLPGNPRYLINLASRRDDFMVGLLAGMIDGRINLMPASHTPGAINDLLDQHPDTALLHGDGDAIDPRIAAHLPQVGIPRLGESWVPDCPDVMPRIAAETVVARVFTSGSTGAPTGHDKTWGRLIANARAAREALDELAPPTQDRLHVLGTVPSQHMYGFESLILAAVCQDTILSIDQPFFPSDIANALAELPSPRLLVTTPYHLQHLLAAGIELPPCERILCATAPLEPALARRAEQAFSGSLHEIYGSTETGQIAVRRPTRDAAWTLMPGIEFRYDGDDTIAQAGHIEAPIRLSDRIEPLSGGRFRLLGRRSNQVNIAGKRSSIEFLNTKLRAIDGVVDGLFFQPVTGEVHRTNRLAAVVCAPALSADQVREALRAEVDPVFLPRPLLLVDRMPVNATGKVTRESLYRLLEDEQTTRAKEAS